MIPLRHTQNLIEISSTTSLFDLLEMRWLRASVTFDVLETPENKPITYWTFPDLLISFATSWLLTCARVWVVPIFVHICFLFLVALHFKNLLFSNSTFTLSYTVKRKSSDPPIMDLKMMRLSHWEIAQLIFKSKSKLFTCLACSYTTGCSSRYSNSFLRYHNNSNETGHIIQNCRIFYNTGFLTRTYMNPCIFPFVLIKLFG